MRRTAATAQVETRRQYGVCGVRSRLQRDVVHRVRRAETATAKNGGDRHPGQQPAAQQRGRGQPHEPAGSAPLWLVQCPPADAGERCTMRQGREQEALASTSDAARWLACPPVPASERPGPPARHDCGVASRARGETRARARPPGPRGGVSRPPTVAVRERGHDAASMLRRRRRPKGESIAQRVCGESVPLASERAAAVVDASVGDRCRGGDLSCVACFSTS